jgi:hypothetical protein
MISWQALLLRTVDEMDCGYSHLAASLTSLFKSQSTFPFHVLCLFLNQFCSLTLQQCSADYHTCACITNSSVEEHNTDMADKSSEGRSTVAVSGYCSVLLQLFSILLTTVTVHYIVYLLVKHLIVYSCHIRN